MSNPDELRHSKNTTPISPRHPDTLLHVYTRSQTTPSLLTAPSALLIHPTIRRTARISVIPAIEPNLAERASIAAINLDDYQHHPVSLCDLPVYGLDTNCSTTDSEGSSKGDESFEFFSDEWSKNNKNTNDFPYEHMVFGRKLIHPKQPISRKAQESKKRDHASTKVDLDTISSRNKEFARYMSMNKGRNHSVHDKKRVLPTSASVKSRWFYHGFGMARVPTEMDLSAIKSRQNRHQRTRSNGSGKEEKGGFHEAKGLGRLIRELSCDGQTQANSMMKASLVCITRD